MEEQIIKVTIRTSGDKCEMTDEEIKDWYRKSIDSLFDHKYGTPEIEIELERKKI